MLNGSSLSDFLLFSYPEFKNIQKNDILICFFLFYFPQTLLLKVLLKTKNKG